MKYIGSGAFVDAAFIKIHFNGTLKEWESINKNGEIFWNYNFRNGMEPEIIDGVVIDGSMTFGEAYEVILRFIHDKYKDKKNIFKI